MSITQAKEIRTTPIAIGQMQEMVPDIQRLLLRWGYDRLNVSFGYGCSLPIDKLWRPTGVDTQQLDKLIEESSQQGIFRFGHSDLHIEDLQETIEFRLCHESDVHFVSFDEQLVKQVVDLWHGSGLTLHASTGPKGSAFPKEWVRIDPGKT